MIELLNQIYFFNLLKNFSPYLTEFIAILSSVSAGLIIGWDREQSGKAAGFRTFALVCLGSCLFTLIAKELNTLDSVSRIVAQIVSGIGFIGAGAVFREKNKISGLTTAAGIWVCSAIGVIFGLGYLPFGMLITLFVFILFRLQRKTEKWLYGVCEIQTVEITFEDVGVNSAKFISALDNKRLNLRKSISSDQMMLKFKIDCCKNHKSHREFLDHLTNLEFIQGINPPISPMENAIEKVN
jgi:putative Mg2+ transporter-C (MgtC) family protein